VTGAVSRRTLLASTSVGAVALLTAGCTPARPIHTSVPSTIGPSDWTALGAALSGKLARPGDASYDTVRLTENPRWDSARPLAVLSAAAASDVAAGLAFAAKHSIPVAVRSGGHSYPGYSAGNGALVIDSRSLDSVSLAADNSVTIGAGASLAQIYDAIGSKGRSIAGGSCATVGITGLTLGGGVGVLVRAYGLACDSLTGVEIVTADGVMHTASATTDPDLFWACRGGGGGHLGVVTSLTFATQPAPEITMFSLSWPAASAAAVVKAWQSWAPGADPKLWSTLKLLNGTAYSEGPGIFVSGTWLGAHAELAGQLAPFLAAAGTPVKNGSSQHSYHDAMMIYAGCGGIPIAQCTTAPGGKLSRESFSATSHVAYVPLDDAGIQKLVTQVVAAKAVAGMHEGGISMDALGGQVATVAPNATAFPHRTALMTVQYTATFADGADPAPLDTYVRGFRAALQPEWGDGAYVNYSDASLTDPTGSYFAANAARLTSVRKKYDPKGFFTQPQSF
jgi:hypothetical protein